MPGKNKLCFFMLLLGIAQPSPVQAEPPAPPWRIIQFDSDIPVTEYQQIEWEGVKAIEAKANASMALLAKPLDVNLMETPILCWLWRVDEPLKSADMAHKSGDDYAARVYVAFDLPDEALSWTTKLKLALAKNIYGNDVPDAAINYVWDNRYPVGTKMANAYTNRTQMIVVETGPEKSGRWVSERANVLMDAQRAFGDHDIQATLLAVASDTDNTGEQARAGFANIHFVESDQACQHEIDTQVHHLGVP